MNIYQHISNTFDRDVFQKLDSFIMSLDIKLSPESFTDADGNEYTIEVEAGKWSAATGQQISAVFIKIDQNGNEEELFKEDATY